MTKPANVKKGETFWCVHRRLAFPMEGVCIALTDNPGKMVGVQFEEEMGGHSCDGRGEEGKCLWLRPNHLYLESEWKSVKKRFEQMALHASRLTGKDIETLG